jgi:hypothetical protein
MKRAHRSAHVFLWLIVLTAGAVGLATALLNLPVDPVTQIPADAVTGEEN